MISNHHVKGGRQENRIPGISLFASDHHRLVIKAPIICIILNPPYGKIWLPCPVINDKYS